MKNKNKIFQVWFKVYGDKKFYTNKIEYDTEQKAIEAARKKFYGWTQAQSWCVVPVGIDPNKNEAALFSSARDTCPHWVDKWTRANQLGIDW